MPAHNENEEFEFRYRLEQEQAARAAAPASPTLPPAASPAPESGSMAFIGQNLEKGVGNLVGLPMDTVANLADLFRMGTGVAAHELTGAQPLATLDRANLPMTSESIHNWMRQQGMLTDAAEPTTGPGRIAASALQALPSGLIGSEMTLPALAGRLGGAAASGASSASAAEAGAPPAVQIAAGMAPSVVKPALAAGKEKIRKGLIGNEDVQANIDLQRRAGVTNPDPAVVANNKGLAQAETTVARLPGGGGLIEKADEQRASDIATRVDQIARTLAPGGAVSAERAGRYVTAGISDAVEALQAKQEDVYRKFDARVSPQHPVRMTNFLRELSDYVKTTPGFERTSKSLKDPSILNLAESIKADLLGQKVDNKTPYSHVKKPDVGKLVFNASGMPVQFKDLNVSPYSTVAGLRSAIGKNLSKSMLVPDATTRLYQRLYKALSDDIRDSLPAQDRNAWNRATHFSKGMHKRIEKVYQPLMDQNTPERALRAAFSGTKEGSSGFRKIMGALTPDQRNAVAAHVIENMGTAPSHMQDAAGGRFSMEHFLTQWDKLKAPGVKEALVPSAKTREDLQTVAEAISRQRAVRTGTYNPSGTAKAVTHASLYSAAFTEIAMSLLRGEPRMAAAGAATLGAQMLASRYAARAMTSPEFIRWLAEGEKVKPADLPAHLARLTVIANHTRDPETREVLQEYATQLNGQ